MNDHHDQRARFARLQELFHRALELPDAQREAFVRQQAGDDAALAEQAFALLRGAGASTERLRPDIDADADAGQELGSDRVQSTATSELLDKLGTSPKLDTNRYQLQGEIAHGGMGAVLRIEDTHLNRRLAMKVMIERRAPRDEEERALAHQLLGRFLEEAQVTSQLDHPGVVPVHELGLDQDGKVYFTMRLVKGRTAREIFALARRGEEDWTLTRALEVILRICDTMAYAHDKGVLHRDLKPANVMVGRFGEVYVMDWGLAKVTGQQDRHDLRIRAEHGSSASRLDTARKRDADDESGSSVVSMDGQKLGTPSYMSPEQARSEALDVRADVYSIGAMVYELLTGQAPYEVPGLWQPAYRLLEKVVEGPPKSIEQIVKGVPAELVAIVGKAMARDRAQRYASTVALAADLRAYLDQRAVQAYRTGALVELKLWVRRNRPLAASLAAAVLILVLGIAGTTIYAGEASQQAAANAELAQEKTQLAAAETKAKDEALEQKQRADTQAAENLRLAQEKGELAAAETKAKDEALQQKQRADTQAAENLRLAQEKGELAAAEAAAKQHFASKVREFDQLKRRVLYDRAIAEEALLYPPWPAKKPAMERWLVETEKLLATRPEIEATVASLRERALPWSEAEQVRDREAHPRFAAYDTLQQRVASLRHAQAIRDGAALVRPELTPALRGMSLKEQHAAAWARVAPFAAAGQEQERTVFGEEALGLVLAETALQRYDAGDRTTKRCSLCDTLAWALLANGQDGAALAMAKAAIESAEGPLKQDQEEDRRRLMEAIDGAARSVAATERVLVAVTAQVGQRATWTFAPEDEASRFLHQTLVDLLGKLATLANNEKAAVVRRTGWANQIESLTLAHPNARHTWAAVRAAVAASANYAGRRIELRDQDVTGLVPIGENPVTGLWEFYELRSAWDGKQDPQQIMIPEHRADGSIEVTWATGIVFVLLPGGTFTMGAQKKDPGRPNYDRGAQWDETPHEVTLLPFFLARHELTQGQWARLWGDTAEWVPSEYRAGWEWDKAEWEPSQYRAGTTNFLGGRMTLAHPVEQVEWTMCDTVLTRHGLALPTEAQWEYGCRGGTTTPWVVGLEQLVDVANVADATAQERSGGWTYEKWRDGHVVHAPVGSFAMNGFGLFDVHGNVLEWSRDWYGDYGSERAGDGRRSVGSSSGHRSYRGGSFSNAAAFARSAHRDRHAPWLRSNDLGLRPARLMTP